MIRVSISGIRRFASAAALCAVTALPGIAANQTMLVFPVDKPETVDQSVADTVTSALNNRVEASAQYDSMAFHVKSPLVSRALSSGTLTDAEVNGPFTKESAAAVARAIGANVALIGSVEDASMDAATNKASVTISVQIINSTDGTAIKTAGTSGEASTAGTAPDALMRLAANAAAEKAATQLFGAPTGKGGRTVSPVPGNTAGGAPPTSVAGPAPAPKHKKNKTGLLIGGILLVGVLIAASSGGGSGSGNNGGGGPPPFPF